MNPVQNRSDHNHTQPTGKLKSHPAAWSELHITRAAIGQRTWYSHMTKMMMVLALLMVAAITAAVAFVPVAVLEITSLLIRKSPLEPWLIAFSWLGSMVIVVIWMAGERKR